MLRNVPNEFAGLFAGAVQDPQYETRVGFLHLVYVDMRRVLELSPRRLARSWYSSMTSTGARRAP